MTACSCVSESVQFHSGGGEDLAREMNGNGTGTGGPLNGPFMGNFLLRVLYNIRKCMTLN